MTEIKYKFAIPTSNNGIINIPLTDGNALFVLGANGVGKSTLMHILFNQNFSHSKRILAHRQTWFPINSTTLNASQKKINEHNIRIADNYKDSRWKDDYSHVRSSISIFDIVNSQNIRARGISSAVDEGNIELAKELSSIQPPLEAINELLAISNISIIISLGNNDELLASKNGSDPYSVSELSDGERNALLICVDVLTAEPNRIIIIDEPEKHLHRSIISPLLSSLFQKRKDCVFVVSTHDIYLPIDHSEASILLLRSCQWNGGEIKDWDADLISEAGDIPISVKRDILGSKRDILFIEGEYSSLDMQIYQLIYPNITIIPQGSCIQVEKAVEGINRAEALHWINAYGLIDSDDRTEDKIQEMHEKRIATLTCYSVEGLYYNIEIIKRIANRLSRLTGEQEEVLYGNAISNIISDIELHKERLCSRLCEKQVRNIIMTQLPKHKEIKAKGIFELNIDLKEIQEKEEKYFDQLVEDANLNELISRYPVRETNVLSNITKGLKMTREQYEMTVRKLIIDDVETKTYFRTLLEPLTTLIEE